jgi:predicted DNA-binding WGR domain protein
MASSSDVTRLEMCGRTGEKFWEISVDSAATKVRYGSTGTTGVLQVKKHKDNSAATAFASKQIESKTSRGYSVVEPLEPLEPVAKRQKKHCPGLTSELPADALAVVAQFIERDKLRNFASASKACVAAVQQSFKTGSPPVACEFSREELESEFANKESLVPIQVVTQHDDLPLNNMGGNIQTHKIALKNNSAVVTIGGVDISLTMTPGSKEEERVRVNPNPNPNPNPNHSYSKRSATASTTTAEEEKEEESDGIPGYCGVEPWRGDESNCWSNRESKTLFVVHPGTSLSKKPSILLIYDLPKTSSGDMAQSKGLLYPRQTIELPYTLTRHERGSDTDEDPHDQDYDDGYFGVGTASISGDGRVLAVLQQASIVVDANDGFYVALYELNQKTDGGVGVVARGVAKVDNPQDDIMDSQCSFIHFGLSMNGSMLLVLSQTMQDSRHVDVWCTLGTQPTKLQETFSTNDFFGDFDYTDFRCCDRVTNKDFVVYGMDPAESSEDQYKLKLPQFLKGRRYEIPHEEY